ncbi:patatin-like phospholipase family protein [Acinetobacter sp. YH01020]|uniref:patatin-like phospholipase family protein n=1 Tax=Acinetobacter sp. YH01020 TaxID=2601034 RepID=UPI0015D1271C|nr:patatin-like phospholipase family protein [Acinetobacter sp. YH01020]
MTQILQKRPPALNIRAGHLARQLLEQEGLNAAQVDILPGAAGGPKGIGIQGLDQAIFADFLPRAQQKRTLIGSSIGSWRFASIAAWGAIEGTKRLSELYTNLSFHKKMSRQEVSDVCRGMLIDLIQGQEAALVNHPDYHLTVLSVKAQHIFQSDKALPLLASVAGIVGTTALARKHSRYFMQRVISQPVSGHQFTVADDGFTTHYHALTQDSVMPWLMASASIPGVMAAIRDIPDAPQGSYRDGGLIDYHIDLPFQSQGIVLYPHFTDSITPGWFDKLFKRQANPENQARTLLLSPSQEYLASLPLGRLPDRKDFTLKGLDNQQRIKMWNQCVAESQRMGDEFLELVEKQHFPAVMQAL